MRFFGWPLVCGVLLALLILQAVPGESFPWDEPLDADLCIDTEQLSVQQGVAKVIELLRARGV